MCRRRKVNQVFDARCGVPVAPAQNGWVTLAEGGERRRGARYREREGCDLASETFRAVPRRPEGVGTWTYLRNLADNEPRAFAIPDDLARALAEHAGAAGRFAALSYSYHRQHVEWIEEAKKPETRAPAHPGDRRGVTGALADRNLPLTPAALSRRLVERTACFSVLTIRAP